jgi:hypothetical protein
MHPIDAASAHGRAAMSAIPTLSDGERIHRTSLPGGLAGDGMGNWISLNELLNNRDADISNQLAA